MRTLTLTLALALAGCSSWHAVGPGDTDLISRARQVRVTSSETGRLYAGTGLRIDLHREGMEDPGYDTAIVTDPYVDESSDPELGFVTLRGNVDLQRCVPGSRWATCRGHYYSSRLSYNPERTRVEVRRTHVGKIVGGSVLATIFLSVAGGVAFSVATR